jgi:hypothetical protein
MGREEKIERYANRQAETERKIGTKKIRKKLIERSKNCCNRGRILNREIYLNRKIDIRRKCSEIVFYRTFHNVMI